MIKFLSFSLSFSFSSASVFQFFFICLISLLFLSIPIHVHAQSFKYTLTYQTSNGEFEVGATRTYNFAHFTTTIERYSQTPLISSQIPISEPGSSISYYNYNAAYVPFFNTDGTVSTGLLVRAQNVSDGKTTPSHLVLTRDLLGNETFSPIGAYNTSLYPIDPQESFGTEDPRIVYNPYDKTYYLYYTACNTNMESDVDSPFVTPRLALATTKDITDPNAWVRHGLIAQSISARKSAALLLKPPGETSHLFFDENEILWATTTDLMNYTVQPGIWLAPRKDSFDASLVEGGPPPMKLSTGDYLMLYNSCKDNSNGICVYNIGFLILNGSAPEQQLFRSPAPILSPELEWEIGTKPYLGLTPYVVFTEGMRTYGNQPDTFMFYYGAADSVIGAAIISLTFDGTGEYGMDMSDPKVATY
jgi:predicted GH43/DUF377 family glycosyl hydrolase